MKTIMILWGILAFSFAHAEGPSEVEGLKRVVENFKTLSQMREVLHELSILSEEKKKEKLLKLIMARPKNLELKIVKKKTERRPREDEKSFSLDDEIERKIALEGLTKEDVKHSEKTSSLANFDKELKKNSDEEGHNSSCRLNIGRKYRRKAFLNARYMLRVYGNRLRDHEKSFLNGLSSLDDEKDFYQHYVSNKEELKENIGNARDLYILTTADKNDSYAGSILRSYKLYYKRIHWIGLLFRKAEKALRGCEGLGADSLDDGSARSAKEQEHNKVPLSGIIYGASER